MVVERIAVSTIVKTGAKAVAAFIGSSVFTVVVIVLVPMWLAAAYFGRDAIHGSGGAGLAMGSAALALVAVPVCLSLTGLYLFHLLGQMESRASLSMAGRVTLACVGSSVLAGMIFIPIVAALGSESVPSQTADLVSRHVPLAFCAFWSMATLYLFRKLKSRVDSR